MTMTPSTLDNLDMGEILWDITLAEHKSVTKENGNSPLDGFTTMLVTNPA